MSCPSVIEFKTRFPEFDTVPDDRIELALNDTCGFLSEKTFGGCWLRASAYYAAHLLKLSLEVTENVSSGMGAGSSSGDITSSGSDGLSVSFSSFTPESREDAWLSTTLYGKIYMSIRDGCVVTGAVDITPSYYGVYYF